MTGGFGSAEGMTFYDAGARVSVLTTQPLDRLLTYRAPEGGCWQGAFVEVPMGPRRVLGVVWGAGSGIIRSRRCRRCCGSRPAHRG